VFQHLLPLRDPETSSVRHILHNSLKYSYNLKKAVFGTTGLLRYNVLNQNSKINKKSLDQFKN
jgi:hypothetical protein